MPTCVISAQVCFCYNWLIFRKVLSIEKSAKKKQRQGIFLRLKSKGCEEERKIDLLADIFQGTFPLYCYYIDTEEYVRKGFVSVNEPMLNEMRYILGEDNVVVRN